MDQCKHCIVRGDIDKCQATDCNYHELWYAKHLESELAESERERKVVQGELFKTAVELAECKAQLAREEKSVNELSLSNQDLHEELKQLNCKLSLIYPPKIRMIQEDS